jgi:serine/threonine-protein kinase
VTGDGPSANGAILLPREVPPASTNPGTAQRWSGYLVGGAGIIGLGIGTAWGAQAINAKSAPGCQNGVCSTNAAAQVQRDGYDAGNRATVAFLAGGALLAGGVALWLTAPSGRSMGLTVAAGVGTALARLEGAW